jgi:hypothetical protein
MRRSRVRVHFVPGWPFVISGLLIASSAASAADRVRDYVYAGKRLIVSVGPQPTATGTPTPVVTPTPTTAPRSTPGPTPTARPVQATGLDTTLPAKQRVLWT